MHKKTIITALAFVTMTVLGGAIMFNGDTSADNVADDRTTAAAGPTVDPAAATRGAYVAAQADCAACHTAPGGKAYAGGYGLETPFGVIYSTNITPDRKTGIGNWTERDFFRAVRHGQHKNGQLLYPAMPYNAYVKISDADMHDLWVYMRTLEPIEQQATSNTLGFPYNIRLSLLGWNLLYFDNSPFTVNPDKSEEWNRGRYLVDGAGHCAACHTPKTRWEATRATTFKAQSYLAATRPRSPATPTVAWAAGAANKFRLISKPAQTIRRLHPGRWGKRSNSQPSTSTTRTSQL